MARIQSTRGGPDIYAHRCCPVSFGIVCRELYNPEKHQGEIVVLDPYDKQRWAERQINWIIKQGQIVRAEYGAAQKYRLKIDMGREREPWKTRIVVSSLPAHLLPSSLARDGAREVCAVEAILTPEDMKRKNRHWYNLGREYNRAEFEVRLIVGAGLRFQIWTLDGVKSRDHEEIEVQWESMDGRLPVNGSVAGSPPQQAHGLGLYRFNSPGSV